MDFKKLSMLIVLVGLLVVGWGCYIYATNEKQEKPKISTEFGGWNQFLKDGEASSNYVLGELERSSNREKAKKIMFFGAGIMGVGYIIKLSAKKEA